MIEATARPKAANWNDDIPKPFRDAEEQFPYLNGLGGYFDVWYTGWAWYLSNEYMGLTWRIVDD